MYRRIYSVEVNRLGKRRELISAFMEVSIIVTNFLECVNCLQILGELLINRTLTHAYVNGNEKRGEQRLMKSITIVIDRNMCGLDVSREQNQLPTHVEINKI